MKTIYDNRLLPCPFCGEEAIIGYFPADERLAKREAFYVGCSNDNCACELEHPGGFKTLEEALAKWNRRARNCDK